MSTSRPIALVALLLALAALGPAPGLRAAAESAPAAGTPDEQALWAEARIHEPPAVTFEVLRVVDGDTIHVRRAGQLEKLRLLSVDTEERISPDIRASETKPQTSFGEECALWARRLFEGLAGEDGKTRVGLAFPRGVEERDVYGRLLCHVVLPDGTDFNLLLVVLGKSPYFNKYGHSELCHDRFVAAQEKARAAERGLWSPDANRPATPGAPDARRPYEKLLPWWGARAAAIDAFRAARAEEPESALSAEDPEALERALARGSEVRVFGSIARFFDEPNGDRTVLLRSPDEKRSLRVRIPRRAREAHAALDLDGTTREYRQNYVWIRGRVLRGQRGLELVSDEPARWSLAGPEPAALEATPASSGRSGR